MTRKSSRKLVLIGGKSSTESCKCGDNAIEEITRKHLANFLIISAMGEEDKEEWGRGIKKSGEGVNSRMIYLIHCKNFCKCHNVPPPSTKK
jgi:hypothetical protein